MTGLKTWLLGVTAAALAVSLAQALTPEGTVKKIGRLAGGLVLLLAAVRPLTSWNGELPKGVSLAPDPGLVEEAAQSGEEAMKILIAQKAGAYIVDKGQSLGCRVTRAAVTVAEDPSGWPVPWSVELTGSWTGEGRQALERAVAEELNIPPERQSYQEEGS